MAVRATTVITLVETYPEGAPAPSQEFVEGYTEHVRQTMMELVEVDRTTVDVKVTLEEATTDGI